MGFSAATDCTASTVGFLRQKTLAGLGKKYKTPNTCPFRAYSLLAVCQTMNAITGFLSKDILFDRLASYGENLMHDVAHYCS